MEECGDEFGMNDMVGVKGEIEGDMRFRGGVEGVKEWFEEGVGDEKYGVDILMDEVWG
ncbi:hypothetical protein [Bacillus pumilus]|uniref:hypothetical protein n=1 Tax=Bacillus pumilus TaxID=1408 RepID=UPI001C92EE2C|nr:hypothetical protein [Bacillus pumilus]